MLRSDLPTHDSMIQAEISQICLPFFDTSQADTSTLPQDAVGKSSKLVALDCLYGEVRANVRHEMNVACVANSRNRIREAGFREVWRPHLALEVEPVLQSA